MVFRSFVGFCVVTIFLAVPLSLLALFAYFCWRYFKDDNNNVHQANEDTLETESLHGDIHLQTGIDEEPYERMPY